MSIEMDPARAYERTYVVRRNLLPIVRPTHGGNHIASIKSGRQGLR